ncbi:MAG TPA: hypothetical protein VJG30_00920 [Candidatus Nanoarchaeia archaeon]|nr:hypothetical protein [Candidatus Nanoarchaeia archaeon]
MKKAQLLSQPFFWIFAIVVMGIILIFSWNAIRDLVGFGEKVGTVKLIEDIKNEVEEIAKSFPGTSIECALTRRAGSSDNECEIIAPSDLKGMCFVDTNSPVDFSKIEFKNVKEEVQVVQGTGDRNVFFATIKNPIDSIYINKLKPKEHFCLNIQQGMKKFILENKGKFVEIRKS